MTKKCNGKFYDDLLCKDVKALTELLASLSNSYRLLVGAADEFNRISLVHRHEAEEAIDRADDLGDIIDDIERELKSVIKLYLNELTCKIEFLQLHNKSSGAASTDIIASADFEDADEEEL